MCRATVPTANNPRVRWIPYTAPMPNVFVSHFTRADATSATTIAATARRPVAMAPQPASIVITEAGPLFSYRTKRGIRRGDGHAS